MTTEEFFDEPTRQQFENEDREAWYRICSILLGIISIGLVLAFFAVWLIA